MLVPVSIVWPIADECGPSATRSFEAVTVTTTPVFQFAPSSVTRTGSAVDSPSAKMSMSTVPVGSVARVSV